MQIIVLGMHRSGTSMVARLLNLGGAYFGPESIATPALPQNPKGFWERQDVRDLCDDMLHAMGAEWYLPTRVRLDDLDEARRDELVERARALIESELAPHEPFFIKEPRLCLLLPLFRPALARPVVVHVVRDPLEVARSLRKRNGFPISMGIGLWEIYEVSALRAAEDLPIVTVRFADVLTDPVGETRRLCEQLVALGVEGLTAPEEGDVRAFVEDRLYRARSEPSESDAYLTPSQRALRDRAADAPAPPLTDAMREIVGTMENQYRDLLAANEKLELERRALQALESTHDQTRRLLDDAGEALRQAEAEAKMARRRMRQLEGRRDNWLEQLEAVKEELYSKEEEASKALRKAKDRAEKAETTFKRMKKERNKLRRKLEKREAELEDLRRNRAVVAFESVEKRVRRLGGLVKRRLRGGPKHETPGTTSESKAASSETRSESTPAHAAPAASAPATVEPKKPPPVRTSAVRVERGEASARRHHESDFHRTVEGLLEQSKHARYREPLEQSERWIAERIDAPLDDAPLVSVVMPTWNREDIVADAVRSVLAQSYEHFELIVCDDGSTDRTLDVLRELADDRVRIIGASHGGAAKARNLALAESRGSLITYLDSDNIWHPDYLAVMVRAMRAHPGRLLAYAKYIDVEIKKSKTVISKAKSLPFDYESLSDKNFVDLNSLVHRRALYERLGGFDEELARQQDWDLVLRYTYLEDPLYVDAFLTLYRRNRDWGQITTTQRRNYAPQERILAKVADYHRSGLPYSFPEDPPRVTVVSWDICRNHFSKAYSVAEVLARRSSVQLLGFEFFKEGLFAPFADESPDFETTYLDGAMFPTFFRAFSDAVNAVRGDVMYVVKPRLGSLGVGLMANYHHGTPLVLEHNDLESVVTIPGAGDTVEAFRPEDVDLADPDLENPYGQTWARLMQHFAQGVPVSTTHNHNLDRFFGARSFFIRNPKDETYFDPARYDRRAVRAELGIGDDQRVILFGGTLRKHKGIQALVDLVERLGPRYRVLFVSSREAKEQRTFRKRTASERVTFLDAQNRNEMARINLAADVTVLWLDPDVPASHYQMPYKLTDALAMKLPVIANDISDLGELGRAGVLRLCPYGSFDELEDTMQKLFSDEPARLAMVAAGRRLYQRQFSYAALERMLPIVLDAALASPGTLAAAESFAEFFARFYEHKRARGASGA